jgi:prevent-host-death family protein
MVTIHYAKTNLSKLLAQVEKGEEVIIARGDKPIAKLVPVQPKGKRFPGMLKGQGSLSYEEAMAPMTEEELAEWGH